MELTSVAKLKQAFYRLVGNVSSDPSLTRQGESTDDLAYLYLTRGTRNAQRWMIDNGMASYWRKRSSALTWTGTDAANGGRYSALPDDFLRLWGDRTRTCSALVEADGDQWGTLIEEEQSRYKGDFYYLKGSNLWITREADPPTTVYLEYHYKHPEIVVGLADASIDFPMDARPLMVVEGAVSAAGDAWLPGGDEMEAKLDRALSKAREEARQIARRTRNARRFAEPFRVANHW